MKYYFNTKGILPHSGNFFYATLLCAISLPFFSGVSVRAIAGSCADTSAQSNRYHCRYWKEYHWDYRDKIVVEEGEVVRVVETETDDTVIALEGSRRDSVIINRGEVSVNVTNSGTNSWWMRRFIRSQRADNWLLNSGRISPDAIAIAGGRGDDVIKNHGLLSSSATTTLIDEPGISYSYSIGITGNDGEDRIVNLGQIDVASEAKVEMSDVTFSLVDDGNAQRQAFALAKGITGDDGEDAIINKGDIIVTADATVDSSIFNITLIGGAVDVDGASEARAGAIGIDSGNGGDRIHNQGTLTVSANAVAESDEVSIELLGLPEAGSVQSPLSATASAIGIYGDGGDERDDWIRNSGTMNVTANARADALNVNISGLRLAGEGAKTTSEATAVGIVGSRDFDKIVSSGNIAVETNANTRTDTVGVTLLDLSLVPGLFGAENQQVTTTAMSTATGIDGGYGSDRIKNSGALDVTANAGLDQFSLGLDLLSGPTDIEGGNEVEANATGITGGEGHDRINNSGSLGVASNARVNVVDVAISAVKLSSSDMSTASLATSVGIDGGWDYSLIRNSGDMDVSATATTGVVSVSFTLVDLTLIPDAINLFTGAEGTDTSTTATADASGIRTGYHSDKIINNGTLSVSADAITNTVEVSSSMDGVSNFTDLESFPDFFLKEPLVDASTTAQASVIGIDSGHGEDNIANNGALIAKAKADVSATSVGVDLPLPSLLPQILPNLDTTEVETAATASASGIKTGKGHDRVRNSSSVWSEATANANSLSVNATLDLPLIDDPIDFNIPYSIEANLVDVGASSEAEAAGIETGDGRDIIKSTGDVTAKAMAKPTATNIAATVAISDDKLSFALSLANASTEGKATATAIDSGNGNDWLLSEGNLLADSSVVSTSTAVTVKLQAIEDTIIGIGASATRANTDADVNSTGIQLGDGHDNLINKGSVTAKAHNNANAIGVDVAVTVPKDDSFGIIGEGTWVSANSIAASLADGIGGGRGRDYISNSGTVVADAFSRPNSVGVAANASGTKKGASIGIALTQAKTEGSATANGISGGEDEDWLVNTGTVNSKAKTDTVAASVAASLALSDKGVALTGTAADASTDATSTATGIIGDEAEDFVDNQGTVDVFADANAVSGSVSVSAQGANKGVALGLALSRATSEATADSQGISGGSEDDDLYSSGQVKSHGKALVIGGSLAVAGGGTSKGLTVVGAAADGSTTGKVTASGISGDQGNDRIVNTGMVDVVADADATSVSVGVTANGTSTGATIGIALGRATSKAEADSQGISGGSDHDSIANSGAVKSHALSTVIAGSAALAAGGSSKGVTVEGAGVDAATDARSTAKGISGDEGYVDIVNKGDLDVLADADAASVSAAISANGTGTGVTFGLGLARATSIAEADSMGISGGIYGDHLYSEGSIKSHANSLVIAGSAALAAGGAGKGLTIEGTGADGSTKGKSTALGLNGADGDDHITSKGAIDTMAKADATSVSVTLAASGTGTGAAVGVAVARAKSEAEADSTAINGGVGNDDIQSSGTLKSHAKSLVIAGSGALAGGGAGKGVSAQGVGVDAQTSGSSNAQGISGGEGRDYILAEEAVDVQSDTSTTSIGVAVTANGTGTGLTFGLGLARAGAEGVANSIGVNGGEDDDILLSRKQIKSHAKSLVIAGSGGLAAGGTGKGVTITGAAVDAASNGQSTAKGVSGDSGKDVIVNQDMVDVLADTDTTSVGLAVTANGTGAGVSLGIGLARTTTIANADSSGISGGEDDDQILNNGLVKSHATSDVIAGSAALAGTFAGKGVALSGAAADASTLGSAHASGIRGDLGIDEVFNKGELDVLADSAATSVSVGASASFSAAGVGLGVSLARTDTKADAVSTGISLGGEADAPEEVAEPEWKKYKYMKASMKDCRRKYGHRKYNSRWNRRKHCGGYEPEPIERTQIVVNSGKITSEAKADADSVSVSVQLGFTGAGVQAGAALADASTRATADSKGIEGSNRKDIIVNQNTIDSIAGADATTTSVGVNFNAGVKALTLGVALTDATANANASSIGIAGLGGDDKIGSSGAITATSTADTNAVAVSVPISLSIVPLSAAFANADAMAIADANAINGGAGNDYLESSGVLLADANSNADGISVSVAPIGVALVGANITAEANAVGVEGDAGDDVILQKENASLTANSKVTATGTTIAATVLGVAGGFDNKSTAISQSTGISAGSGNNKTVNLGSISTDASSEATGTSVSAALTGVTIANTTTIATTHSTGVSGGDDQDLILNQGNILVAGSSKTIGTSVGASVDPVSFADTTSTSVTHGTGMSGGNGDDDIVNLGSIDVTGNSTATGTSVGVALRYAAFSDASTSAATHSTGISGDAGLDNLLNLDSIKTTANSTATGTSVSAGLAGATFADSNTDATSYSTGISAGAGLDKILNLGSIETEANSTATGTTVSATLAGASFADLSSKAESNAIGIATGSGADMLLNKAAINAKANATANGASIAAGFLGFFDGDAGTTVSANATGIDLGSGDDETFSEGTIDIAVNSNSKVTTGSGTLVGASSSKANITSTIAAMGIDGAEGNDLIINKGTITIGSGSASDLWMSSLTSTTFSLTIVGAANAESALFAKTESIGVDGGAGDDQIHNAGDLNIAATSYSSSTSTSIGIFGAAGSEGSAGAITRASGIAGGDGNDEIENLNLINVSSDTFASISGSSFTFAGGSSNDGALTAEGRVMGISAGIGDDLIDNKGQIKINTKANLRITGGSKVIFGVASADSATSADLLAVGIDTDAGNDVIKNNALIDVTTNAITTSSRTAYAFAGGSNVTSQLSANSTSKGISSGLGDDEVFNSGNITVNSISSLSATGGTSSTIAGSAVSAATVSASSQLSGIETGGGNDRLFNIANITGTTNANSSSVNDANAGTFFSDGITRSTAIVSSSAFGMNAGSGDNLVINKGNLLINTIGKATATAKSDGDIIDNILGIDQDAFATSNATVSSGEAVGVVANDGLNEVANLGNITIDLKPQAFSNSNANGDAIISGDGTANATSRADNLKAFGMKFGQGNNWVKNSGTITVKSRPRINATTYSDADGVGEFREPDSRANSFAYANNALAVGIWSGDGNNTVINDGILNIESAPNADRANAFADFGGDVLGIDAFARATARANNAQAYGIRVGNGNNVILNDGSLSVASRPRAVVRAFANAVGFDGDASAWANANANNAFAVGIRAGNGGNKVFNNGTINVIAAPYAFADAIVSPGSNALNNGEVEAFEENATTANARAFGILTGSGDDYILNNGTISVDATGSSPTEIAIHSGAGNDIIDLADASTTTGAIELGANDDILHILNTPVVNGRISGGSGIDTVVYDGEGTFTNVLEPDFENVVKQGAGTYTLPALPSMENIAIEEGLLEIESNYQLAAGTAITPSVSSGVGQGSIVINGALNISDGKIDIVIGSGHHIDGDRQSVITASEGIVNSLTANNIKLPEPSPLLTFYDEMTASELNITSSVEPFVTVANSSNEEAIASYMDDLLADAEGDVSLVLGEVQILADGEHSAAFGSLSPETHVNSQQALEIGVRHHMSTLRQRTRGLRRVSEYDGFMQPGFVSSDDVLLADKFDSHLQGIQHLLATNQQQTSGWVKSSLQDGQLDQTAANTGFEFDGSSYTFGFDQRLGAHKIIGLSVANNTTSVRANSNQSNSDIDSQLVSAYSGIINDTGYVNGLISSAYNIFETNRRVTVGAIDSTVVSEHSGNVYSASLEGGLFIPASRWQIEAYGALHYQRHEEEGFREQGAGGIGLDVKPRNSDSIGSELGLRFARQFDNRYSRLFTEFDIALLHELKDDNSIRASFVDTPDSSFTVEAQDIDSNGISLGTGLTYLVGREFTAAAEFRSELREDYSDQILSGSMQYRFD